MRFGYVYFSPMCNLVQLNTSVARFSFFFTFASAFLGFLNAGMSLHIECPLIFVIYNLRKMFRSQFHDSVF